MPEDRQQCDILLALREHPFTSQRILAEETGYSIGLVNKQLNKLVEEGYLDAAKNFTPKTTALFEEGRPANAVILAAGFGMRMVPINLTSPKALMEIQGERLIERLIRQLHEAGDHRYHGGRRLYEGVLRVPDRRVRRRAGRERPVRRPTTSIPVGLVSWTASQYVHGPQRHLVRENPFPRASCTPGTWFPTGRIRNPTCG